MSLPKFSSAVDVEAVLSSPLFTPPAAPETITGHLATLRSEMARFSDGTTHAARRADVEESITRLNDAAVRTDAQRRAAGVLDGVRVDAVADLGFVIPTQTLATALGVPAEDLNALRSDVTAVVEVIGRQMPASAEANNAAGRLLQRFAEHPSGPVAPISLLYQNHDATAALLGSVVLASHEGTKRRSALARTVRVATATEIIADTRIDAGTTVELDLESSGYEFGVGPHHCPGRVLAQEIVAGIKAALDSAGYRVIEALVERHPDGRARSIPMEAV